MFFPVMLELEKLDILVIGGGEIAYKKSLKLLENGGRIKIISKEVNEKIYGLRDVYDDRLEIEEKLIDETFDVEVLKNYDLVYLATNSNYLNEKLSIYCMENKILVNSVDNHMKSTFINTGFVNKKIDDEDVVVSVSCLGKNPKKVKNIIDKIKKSNDIW